MKDFQYRAADTRRSLSMNVLKLLTGLAVLGVTVFAFVIAPERMASKLDEKARGMVFLGVVGLVLAPICYGGLLMLKWGLRPSSPSKPPE